MGPRGSMYFIIYVLGPLKSLNRRYLKAQVFPI